MTIEVQNRFKDINTLSNELVSIMAIDNPTSKQSRRMADISAAINSLKAGASMTEIRNWNLESLREELGLSRLPEAPRTALGAEIEAEWRKWAVTGECRPTQIPPRESRYTGQLAGQQSLTDTLGPQGGYFVAPGMSPRLYETMKQYDAIFDPELSNVVESSDGAVTAFPIWDDVANEAVLVGETVQSTEVTIAAVNSTQLHAYSYRSKIVAVSIELLQDANWAVGSILEQIFAKRIARGVGRAMISGTGTNQPTGLVTGALAAGATVVVAAGSATNTGGSELGTVTVGTQDIGRLYAALNPAYRTGANFYMNDSTLQYLAQLIDKNGRPIIDFGIGPVRGGTTPILWGHAVGICPSMPSMAPGANSIVFANPTYIIQRRVPSATYVRAYREAVGLIEAGMYAFEEFARFDSNFISGNSSFVPAAVLQQHS